ncbi:MULTISPECIES: hypothetical protein [Lysobacter]|jgi:hypothetical protein|uniref:Uncharacterized protein n=1 Tax=Lysobacter capsici AZ78 TaxID=1444315 RepID=A0A120AFK7_9GAMM|nr:MULTISPECIES: hypothetical protein [Lysobacter]MBW8808029.1 hypothetical protein [Lysobacter sp.]ALN85668.1 hypothetical protein LC55x_2403 [Lysobacter capsici]ATE71766.1 hypothetical protein CNO08_10650 [Lysobacter capsici]KWS03183.1 hypothetical protein AZ78_0729 [Lysobacter capsici AZ78]QWF19315.1 hypothetical protein KME82_11520 [Lysobacter capsici]
MDNHVEWFQFTLSNGQTIGPAPLRLIWMEASGTTNVTVLRSQRLLLGKRTAVYSLRASPRLANIRVIEARLRSLLENARLHSVLTAVSH